MAVHGNFAISYEVIKRRFRIGLNGFFFEQISDTKVNGVKTAAENRPEGVRFNLRWTHHF